MPEEPDQIIIQSAELQVLMEHSPQETMDKYFQMDTSHPFSPRMVLKPHVRVVMATGEVEQLGFGLDVANWFTMKNRRRAYTKKRKANPALKPVVSAGDSWFSHPLLSDVVNQLGDGHGYAVYSLDAAGAELSQIVSSGDWAKALVSEGSSTLLLSGGGNDLMGDHFGDYLRNGIAPGSAPADYLSTAFEDALNGVLDLYQTIIDRVKDEFPAVKVFTHSYDYALPRPNGKWLGPPMIHHGITDQVDQRRIIRHIVDRFTGRLQRLAAASPEQVHYIPRRVNVGEMQWDDEIHPVSAGFAIVGGNFQAALSNAGVSP